jgi:hypothetical protein
VSLESRLGRVVKTENRGRGNKERIMKDNEEGKNA